MRVSEVWVYLSHKPRDSFLYLKEIIFTFPINYILKISKWVIWAGLFYFQSVWNTKRLKGITTDILETTTHRKKSQKHTLSGAAYRDAAGPESTLFGASVLSSVQWRQCSKIITSQGCGERFSFWCTAGGLPPKTPGRCFSSRDALPCASRAAPRGRGELAAEYGSGARQGQVGRSYDV